MGCTRWNSSTSLDHDKNKDHSWVIVCREPCRVIFWLAVYIISLDPHSALADKYILDRVGSVNVTFKRADVVPTSHVVPLPPVFNGGAPLPDRMHEKISHWTKWVKPNLMLSTSLNSQRNKAHSPVSPQTRLYPKPSCCTRIGLGGRSCGRSDRPIYIPLSLTR